MAEPILRVAGLRKSYGGLTVTDDVSLDLRPGEIHALIGPNGAGKSTLIGQICGSVMPDAGSVSFDGRDITRWNTAERARAGLGRTFQISTILPEFTALAHTMLAVQARQGTSFRFFRPTALDRSLRDPAMQALARVGLDGRAEIPAASLSHGERRRLEVALVLALGSKALVMDEPMAGMGSEGSRELTALLSQLRHETPILMVEHDMDAVFALADRISVLVYGRIVATGTPDEIRSDRLVREAYLGEASA
ncbi:ABC transporter ATP-binding protein [Fulvimarina endophytica]|uniref:ABC transporter ATP-binding protein n=1 Tax=Fulvimarina endophytica TaxID=2293836 RepID=A0A371X2M0_9HYPH|nr:ABC transporter ATP-binding protein [Fulvimarina endophytica]RFC63453.1 ABC transporter ATP-binding protein [Fulvimarina endophytica]